MTVKNGMRSRYFGTTPQFWMNLQQTFELRTAEETSGAEVAATVQPVCRSLSSHV